MVQSVNKTPEAFRSDSSQGRIRETGVFIGIVKNNQDPQRMGRLTVCIPELGGNPSDSGTWIPASYASPFAGATNVESNSASSTTQDGSQKSYGWWAVPPDLNNEVLVCFINGDPNKAIWFGCLYQQFMNHMVPAVALNRSTNDQVNAQNLPPVTEYNKKDQKNSSGTYWDPPRPIFEPLYNGLRSQGLFTDPERGPATTSARRETPSKVFGFLTPRSNSIHIDDDEDNEFIRLRTRSGVQILIHETTGYIYMISKLGNSWFEISDEGIDMYSKKTISMRAEEAINMHADMAINQHSGGGAHSRADNHTMKSEGSTAFSTDGPHKVDAKTHDQKADSHTRSGQKITDAKGGNQQTSKNGQKVAGSSGSSSPANYNNLNNKGTNAPIDSSAAGGRDPQNVINYIRQSAERQGVNPDLAVAIGRAEGIAPKTLNSDDYGNPDVGGRSYGPFQFYMSGGSPDAYNKPSVGTAFQQATGQYPSADNWQQQVDYGVGVMAQGQSGLNNWSAYKFGKYKQYM